MDQVDASLVAVAEERTLRNGFTLDRGFCIYRLFGRRLCAVVP